MRQPYEGIEDEEPGYEIGNRLLVTAQIGLGDRAKRWGAARSESDPADDAVFLPVNPQVRTHPGAASTFGCVPGAANGSMWLG